MTSGKPSQAQMVALAATVEGLSDMGLNFTDHKGANAAQVAQRVGRAGYSITGVAMRDHFNPAYKRGTFADPDHADNDATAGAVGCSYTVSRDYMAP